MDQPRQKKLNQMNGNKTNGDKKKYLLHHSQMKCLSNFTR